jgi:hypothetical protein
MCTTTEENDKTFVVLVGMAGYLLLTIVCSVRDVARLSQPQPWETLASVVQPVAVSCARLGHASGVYHWRPVTILCELTCRVGMLVVRAG